MQDLSDFEDPSIHRLRQAKGSPIEGVRSSQIVGKGVQEARDEHAKELVTIQEKVNTLSKNTNRRLYKISSVFPFDLLPSILIVEETKINLVFRVFFGAKLIHTVDIKDITNVFLETAPIFATIKIVSRTFKENEITMGHLRKEHAARAKDIIEALRLIYNQHIDTSKFDETELMKFINNVIGESSSKLM